MSQTKNEFKINIQGPPYSGVSAIAFLITHFFTRHGGEVSWHPSVRSKVRTSDIGAASDEDDNENQVRGVMTWGTFVLSVDETERQSNELRVFLIQRWNPANDVAQHLGFVTERKASSVFGRFEYSSTAPLLAEGQRIFQRMSLKPRDFAQTVIDGCVVEAVDVTDLEDVWKKTIPEDVWKNFTQPGT